MTRKENRDVIVLSYFDCVVRESDIKILRSDSWINDQIIGFYFTYLENERYKSKNEILLIGPEVSQCLKESPPEDIFVFLDPLEAKHKSLIFFAVNDSGKSAGGSHWSLLIYSRLVNKFYHSDSSSPANCQSALKLARNVGKYFNPSSEPEFEEMVSLQQNNSYDCGIYLICNLENIVEHITANNGDLSNLPSLKRDIVSTKRKDLLDLIENCKKQQK